MPLKRFVLLFASVGLALPIAWSVTWRIINVSNPRAVAYIMSAEWTDILLLTVWPSSIVMVGDPNDTNLPLLAISVALNAVFYGLVGGLVWLVVQKLSRGERPMQKA